LESARVQADKDRKNKTEEIISEKSKLIKSKRTRIVSDDSNNEKVDLKSDAEHKSIRSGFKAVVNDAMEADYDKKHSKKKKRKDKDPE